MDSATVVGAIGASDSVFEGVVFVENRSGFCICRLVDSQDCRVESEAGDLEVPFS